MISDPFVCIRGAKQGTIEWFIHPIRKSHDGLVYDNYVGPRQNVWQEYARFEREKLRKIGGYGSYLDCCNHWVGGYGLVKKAGHWTYTSNEIIGYGRTDYEDDSESSRLLKRAEFLKAVCAKEGIEWLPKDKPAPCGCYSQPSQETMGNNEYYSKLEIEEMYDDLLEHAKMHADEQDKRREQEFQKKILAPWRDELLDFLGSWMQNSHPINAKKSIDHIKRLRSQFLR